jgi:hypothetical protein
MKRPNFRCTVCYFLAFAITFGLGGFSTLAADTPGPAGTSADGWIALFNGKDLSGWQNAAGGPPGQSWVVQDGAMVRTKAAGDVWSKDCFGDFILDLEFKTEGNSGIFIRTGNPKDCVQTGLEIQVYTPVARPSRGSCGALYDAVAPAKEASKKGQWNHVVITAKGSRITVVMNGEPIVDADLDRWTEPHKNPDGSKNKYNKALKDFPRQGHIGLQDHGANVAYRNIKLKPLK